MYKFGIKEKANLFKAVSNIGEKNNKTNINNTRSANKYAEIIFIKYINLSNFIQISLFESNLLIRNKLDKFTKRT